MTDISLALMHFAALIVELFLVIYCIAALRKMRRLKVHTTFMKPVLLFGLIILGARIAEMASEYMQIPHLILIECAVIVVAFSILTYGVYDYNRMLEKMLKKQ